MIIAIVVIEYESDGSHLLEYVCCIIFVERCPYRVQGGGNFSQTYISSLSSAWI